MWRLYALVAGVIAITVWHKPIERMMNFAGTLITYTSIFLLCLIGTWLTRKTWDYYRSRPQRVEDAPPTVVLRPVPDRDETVPLPQVPEIEPSRVISLEEWRRKAIENDTVS